MFIDIEKDDGIGRTGQRHEAVKQLMHLASQRPWSPPLSFPPILDHLSLHLLFWCHTFVVSIPLILFGSVISGDHTFSRPPTLRLYNQRLSLLTKKSVVKGKTKQNSITKNTKNTGYSMAFFSKHKDINFG